MNQSIAPNVAILPNDFTHTPEIQNLGTNGGNLWEVSQFHHRSRGTHQLGILVPAQRIPSDLHHGHDASRLALGSRQLPGTMGMITQQDSFPFSWGYLW